MFSNFIEINMEEDKLGERIFAAARTTKDFLILRFIALSNLVRKASVIEV